MAPDQLTLHHLTADSQNNPIGIDNLQPQLSWMLRSAQRGVLQAAYRIQAAATQANLETGEANLWDSGRIESAQSVYVGYAGSPLTSRQRVYWRVKAWDQTSRESAWSKTAWFEMGLLQPGDWQSDWIGAPIQVNLPKEPAPAFAPYFRKAFKLNGKVHSARAYICGLGYFELSINGARVGDHVLDPAFTRYDRRVLYVTHDVTGLLLPGENSVGVILGNGLYNQTMPDAWHFNVTPWRGKPCLRFQLEIVYENGERSKVDSDWSWKVSDGPIRANATRSGESYDARREMPGWDQHGFDDQAWRPAIVVSGPAGVLRAQCLPPIRVMETLEPDSLSEPEAGIFVYDMGQNFAGWAQLRLYGPAGAEVTLRYGEKLNPRGRLDQSNLNMHIYEAEVQTDHYTLKGQGYEVFEPHFTYHGFRYIEMMGFPGRPGLDNLRGRVVHTSFERGGSFECSDDLINRIQHATVWSYTSNFHGYPTDCPHREKNGWTGDAHLAAEAGLYNFQSATAYRKWLEDFADEQQPSGELPGIIPTSGWGYQWGNGPCWDSAYILIPWYLYLYEGDLSVLARHYEGMKRYVDYVRGRSPSGLASFGLGDWVPPFGNPEDYTAPLTLMATAYYYLVVTILARAASLLGKAEDTSNLRDLAHQIRKVFNARFYDPASGLYASGSQSAQSAALACGLVEPRQAAKVVRQLVAEIRQQNWRINAGIHGTKFVLNALAGADRNSVAYRLVTQRRYPSWGYMIDQGATTLWEEYNGTSSLMHIMFGDVSAWFYKQLAGLQPEVDQPGFKRALICPWLTPGLEWVKAEHMTVYGVYKIALERQQSGRLRLDVTIPANATAEISVPASNPDEVQESGVPAGRADGLAFLRFENGRAVFEAGSGDYHFESVW